MTLVCAAQGRAPCLKGVCTPLSACVRPPVCVQFKVKMVSTDDDRATDIVVEGDKEEIERFWKVRLCMQASAPAPAPASGEALHGMHTRTVAGKGLEPYGWPCFRIAPGYDMIHHCCAA